MRYVLLLLLLAAVALAAPAAGESAPGPKPKQICVGNGPSCFPTLAAAIAAANDGDTLKLDPGTYAGGVSVDKSIHLVGAGAHQTILSGGGPVLTIGVE